jgi:hypothetical protein
MTHIDIIRKKIKKLTFPLHLVQVLGSPSSPLIFATSSFWQGLKVSAELASVQSPHPAPSFSFQNKSIFMYNSISTVYGLGQLTSSQCCVPFDGL